MTPRKRHLTAVYGEQGADVNELLGFGEDGYVWRSVGTTAVKAFYRIRNYMVELACYTRLSTWNGVTELAGFAVPALLGHDDHLTVIEMGIVAPPCVLDFGKAYLDRPGDYPEGVLEDSLDSFRENFSERRGYVWAVSIPSLGETRQRGNSTRPMKFTR